MSSGAALFNRRPPHFSTGVYREVRVARGGDVSGVIWISTTTGKAKVLYPQ
jgi:hypothetical protein